MIRTQVYLPDDLYSLAKLEAATRGINVSEILRLGLWNEVGKPKKVNKKKKLFANLAGALKYGPKDLSTRIDEIYK
jgi:hypothetical protein